MHLLAQEVHERVAPAADLVYLGGDGAQLSFGADLVEVHRQRAQQLLGDEVDGPDVGVQEARDVALEEVGVGDEDTAQLELHVEGGGQPLEQRRVGLDDAHPAADLRQVVRVDHRLPLVGGSADVRVLEPPVQDVLDEVVGRLDVARLADRDADRLVAGEAGEQELVVAVAEELGEPGEDADGVGVPVRLHHLLDDAEQVGHDLLLPVAQGLVLEEEQADGEAVFQVLDPEQGVDGLGEDRGEHRERRREQTVVRRRAQRVEQRGEPALLEKGELAGDRARVGEVLALRERPGRDVEPVAHGTVPGGEELAEERLVRRREIRTLRRPLGEVAEQRVALEELRLVFRHEAHERAGKAGERLVVLAGVASPKRVRGPRGQRTQQQGELVRRDRRVEEADGEFREQAEELGAARRALEVRPVAQQRRLQAVHQQRRVAERVEVLAHGLRERRAHAVEPVDRLQQRQVAVGDDHFLRRVGEVGAQGFGVERHG